MRYWIISELFYPEEVSTGYVMTKIAEKLNEKVDVGVICGPSGYQSKILSATYTLAEDILIKRVRIPHLNKNKFLPRLLSFSLLTCGIAIKMLTNVKRRDEVILVTNPPTLLPMVAFISKLIGYKFTIIVHDVFPENAIAGGMLRKDALVSKILTNFFNKAYNSAQKLIVVGEDMRELFRKKIKKNLSVDVITNWADLEEISPLNMTSIDFSKYYSHNFNEKIIIQFAGNIGRVQGLVEYFNFLKKVKNEFLETVFIGSGAELPKLEKLYIENNLKQIHFIKPKPRFEQNIFLNSCHIGLVTLTPGMFGLGVPSKAYNILAAGKPILYIGDKNAEIARYINEYNVGWAFTWDEKASIITFLNQLNSSFLEEISEKGKNARKLVEFNFNKRIILDLYKKSILSDRE